MDWAALAALPGDARLLHGRARAAADRRAARSRAAGRRRARRGRRARHAARPARRSSATLADIAERRREAGVGAPAITLVGAVAGAARASSRGSSARPLRGPHASRSRAPARRPAALAARLRDLGAEVVEAPAIRDPVRSTVDAARPRRLRPAVPDEPQRRATAVRAACATRARPGRAARSPRSARGPPRALREHGDRAPTSCPERAVAEGLRRGARRRRRAARADRARREGRDVLPDALRERGAEVDVVALYETRRRAARRRDARRRPGRGLRHVHLGLDRALARCASAARPSAGRGSSRSARSRAPRCASTASSRPRGRRAHARRPGRRARRRPVAASTPSGAGHRAAPLGLVVTVGRRAARARAHRRAAGGSSVLAVRSWACARRPI